MTLTSRALWVIERNLDRDLSLADIAEACGVTRFHLAHAFGQATGTTAMDYLRGRRLTEAARALTDGAGNILQVALDAGYASHEAFSRAFRARFGMTPEAARRAGAGAALTLVEAIERPALTGPPLAAPRFERAGPIQVVGLLEPCAFGQTSGVTAQWRRFMDLFGGIPNRANPIPVGVATDFEESGAFAYLCAAEVSDSAGAPRALAARRIPAQTYAVFLHDGHVSALWDTYGAILDRWAPDHGRVVAGTAYLERHCETFDPGTGMGGVELWIPLAA